MEHGREHCPNHSECLTCSLTAASKSDTGGGALGDLFFLFFRDLTLENPEYMNVEESPAVKNAHHYGSRISCPSACYPNNIR
jgi:hypothetical protein